MRLNETLLRQITLGVIFSSSIIFVSSYFAQSAWLEQFRPELVTRTSTEWPSIFHFWILEKIAIIILPAAVITYLYLPQYVHWLRQSNPTQRSIALTALLIAIQLALAIAYWATRDMAGTGLDSIKSVFWLGDELNIPTCFAAVQLWLASWLCFECHRIRKSSTWLISALICFYLGLDELLSIHEMIGSQAREALLFGESEKTIKIGFVNAYRWQLIFIPIAALASTWFFIAFRRTVTLRQLILLSTAGGLFLAGGLGMEFIEATQISKNENWLSTKSGQINLLIEEKLESLGVSISVFVFAEHRWNLLEKRTV